MKCPNCGKDNRAKSAKFCTACGTSLTGELPASWQSGGVKVQGDAQAGGDIIGRDKISAGDNAIVNTGSGAVATGGGVAAGAGGVAIGGNVAGNVIVKPTQVVHTEPSRKADQALLRGYLNWVMNECAPLKLKAIDQGAARPSQQPLGLTSVYVDLNLDLHIPQKMTLAKYLAAGRQTGESKENRHAEMGREPAETRLVPVLEALAHHPRLVLLGAPGSGKSTLSAYLALSLAQAGLGDKDALKRLGKGWLHGPLLPVRIVLRQFAASLPEDLPQGRASHLWSFIGSELGHCGLPEKTVAWQQETAQKSGGLFLLDGLDEAGDETRRARVLEAVEEFTRTAGGQSRYLITARPYAWEEAAGSAEPSAEQKHHHELKTCFQAVYRLADFDTPQIKTFIEHWYAAVTAAGWVTPTEAEERSASLQAAAQRVDLQALAHNPLLLTLMATLHSNRGRLPDDRADLYNDTVELLLQRWNEPTGADRSLLETLGVPSLKLADLRAVIERVAYEAHAGHVGRSGTADLPELALLAAFRPLLGGSLDKAAKVVEYIENRAGLLIAQGPRAGLRQFTFPHRAFQEYLAACYLAAQTDFSQRARSLAYGPEPYHWQEVLVMAARRAGAYQGVAVADALVHAQRFTDYGRKGPAPIESDWRAAVLAGEQLLEIGTAALNSDETFGAVRERVAGWLAALLQNGALPVRERAYAGDVLAKLGDPRFRADAWFLPNEPRLGFVEIPAGPFLMGSDPQKDEEAEDREQPQHPFTLPGYYMACYPVTVAQYRAFVQASGYDKTHPAWQNDLPNRPVRVVTWYDALAYCDWLTETLTDWPDTPAPLAELLRSRKWRITLPTEAQWEKAARGREEQGRRFAWGDDYDPEKANVGDTHLNDTSTVGVFPAGATPEGLLDMTGNVWEWCQSKYAPYPYQTEDGRETLDKSGAPRVLRGGAFLNVRRHVRCAYRWLLPDRRLDNLGFRCVCVPL